MLITPSIREIPNSRTDLLAFRIGGTVTRDDFAAMGRRAREAFDANPGSTDMLLIFDAYEGSETFAGMSWPGIASRIEAVSHVGRYVVAGAPKAAATMVEAVGAILPLDAEAFDHERDAWAYLAARPS